MPTNLPQPVDSLPLSSSPPRPHAPPPPGAPQHAPGASGTWWWRVRLLPACLLAASLTLLGIAASLSPSDAGIGTHQRLGLPACGVLQSTGMPCATCGMTTAYAHAVRGNLWRSFLTQPAGALFAVLTAAAAIIAATALVTGLDLRPLWFWIWRPRTVAIIGGGVIGAWLYKITTMMTFG